MTGEEWELANSGGCGSEQRLLSGRNAESRYGVLGNGSNAKQFDEKKMKNNKKKMRLNARSCINIQGVSVGRKQTEEHWTAERIQQPIRESQPAECHETYQTKLPEYSN